MLKTAQKGEKQMARARFSKRSQITIPKKIVEALQLQEGDELDVELDQQGRIVIEPTVSIPKSQAFYWTKEWQEAEEVAEEQKKYGDIPEPLEGEDFVKLMEKWTKDSKDDF